MKKHLMVFCITIAMAAAVWPALADDTGGGAPAVSISGFEHSEDGETFLLALLWVENITGLNSARVDVVYETAALELLNVLSDTDIDAPGKQNFLGPGVLHVNSIKEKGVSEYAVSRTWKEGEAPAGASGSGAVGLLLFRILGGEETTISIRRETLRLMNDAENPVPEMSPDFIINEFTYDPAGD